MSKSVRERTEEVLQPILEKQNLELVDIEYVKEGPDWYLRVYIDKEGGITIDECGDVSGELSDELDKDDFIPGSYFLEVSSPGVERPLNSQKDFEKNIGKNVYVTLYAPVDGNKDYEGILKDFANEIATIEYQVLSRKKIVEVPYKKIARARLAVAL